MSPEAFWATYGQEAPRVVHPVPFMCAEPDCPRSADVTWTGQYRDHCEGHTYGPAVRANCPAGHELTAENRVRTGLRGSQCRICKNAGRRERLRAQRQATA